MMKTVCVLLTLLISAQCVVIYNSTAVGNICDWLPSNGDDQWWKCTKPPSTQTYINSCGGDPARKCWYMKDWSVAINASVYSPIFDLTSFTNISISFNVAWDTETMYDGVNFGVNFNSTKNFLSPLPPTADGFVAIGSPDAFVDPNHWYNRWFDDTNNRDIESLLAYTGNPSGWSGSDKMSSGGFGGVNSTSAGWVRAKRQFPPTAKYGAHVQFRFAYASDAGSTSGMEGFGMDDFILYGDPLPVSSSTSTPSSSSPSDAIQATSSPEESNGGAIAGGIIGGLAGLAIIAILVFFVLRYRSKKHSQLENQVENQFESPREEKTRKSREITGDIPMSQVQRKKYSELNGELKLSDVVIGEILGKGNFGVVYKGVWQETTPVALKGITGEDLDEFLAEAVITKGLNHPNCVRFLGIFLEDEKIFIVTEFMARGSLLNLLRSEFQVENSRLIQMAIDICAGMKYLESKKVIHRDLSARNVLVDDHDVVKISDFGMSRTQAGDYYQVTNKVMPIKWTAPEVITHGKYTFNSDVWSFGVVLHEIYTLGGEPYPGMTNTEVISKLQSGWRMPKSEQCPIEIYQLMLRCWSANPTERPNFLEIRKALETFRDEVAVIALSLNPDASKKYDDASYEPVSMESPQPNTTNTQGSNLYSVATLVPSDDAKPSASASPSDHPTYSAPIIVADGEPIVTKYEDLHLSFKKE